MTVARTLADERRAGQALREWLPSAIRERGTKLGGSAARRSLVALQDLTRDGPAYGRESEKAGLQRYPCGV